MARVLVIDDDPAVAEFVRDAALTMGHDVTVCSNGVEAKGAVQNGHFDQIITDIVMPRFDGVEFMRWLSLRDSKPDVIFMSGFDTVYCNAATLIAEQGGIKVRGILQKPFRVRQLMELLA